MDRWVPRSALDRGHQAADEDAWFAAMWGRSDARVLGVATGSRVTATEGSDALDLGRTTGPWNRQAHLFIGLINGEPRFAQRVDAGHLVGLRHLNRVLSDTDADLATTAVALVNWHAEAVWCGRCGTRTSPRFGGQQRWCPTCEEPHFPRTDPAVIVAVLDPRDRLLLAHQGAWDTNRWSILAGFVEEGESLEQAVHREILEEAGVQVGTPAYLGSQPWPYPRSLMVGFVAFSDGGPITVDGVELEAARYFSRVALTEAIAAGEVELPGSDSIASRIIAAWREGTLSLLSSGG